MSRDEAMNTRLDGTEPILCAPIIRQVDEQLIELLTSLDSAEWDLPTIVPQWTVRDVAAHLLDTGLRRLSMGRDNCRLENVAIGLASRRHYPRQPPQSRRRGLPPSQSSRSHTTHAAYMPANSRLL
jgi:hypothetical protein